MKKAILAKKVGMTQIFNEAGELVPVTVLQAGPCVVTQVKTTENDGYEAVQVGFEDIREKLVNKPVKGMFDKAGVSYKRYVREFNLAVHGELGDHGRARGELRLATKGHEHGCGTDGRCKAACTKAGSRHLPTEAL